LKDAKRPADSSQRGEAGNPYRSTQSAREAGQTSAVPLGRYVLFAVIAGGGCLIDLATKSLIFAWRGSPRQDNVWWIWEGYFGIETALNPGALFGMGRQFGPLFAGLSVAAAIGIVYWLFLRKGARDLELTIALSSVMGGILGNLYDRLGFGQPAGIDGHWQTEVRDWILFRYQDYTWPNFNIADCMLVCGAALLMWHALLRREPKPSAEKSASSI
jgi:signal peptidase II